MANKTIRMRLDVRSIENAIRALEAYRDGVEERTHQLVDRLTENGAEEARAAFGNMASVDSVSSGNTGLIEASGPAVIIAEFGAGLSTMENHPMAENAPVPIERWSYSRAYGGEAWQYAEAGSVAPGEIEPGWWYFGGKQMARVEPRHGIMDARDYIENNLVDEARSVFR